MIKEELKQFNINMCDIKEEDNFYKKLNEAIYKMQEYTLRDRFEVVLNNNLIESKEIPTNLRTIMGCRVSYADLEKDISFIVKEDFKPSYETLEHRIDKAIEYIENNSLYKEEIDYDYEETPIYVGCNDIKAREELLDILKGEK